ncbi:MAG: nicotinate-nucleotide adenylyltransferase [Gemmatimonadales bacterium]
MDALFGGSFDPVHLGHLIVAEAAADALGAEVRVRFVPAREQPFKRGAQGASPEQRAAMLELAVQGNPRFAVERIELDLPAPSYTVQTLRALVAREPETRFALLLGADAAQEVRTWREAAELPRLACVVAFARAGVPPSRNAIVDRVIEVPGIAISATDIRARVAQGRSIRYLVPEAVRNYIARHQLYR